ncbi:MAG: ATP-binding protein [Chloroflexota bacterium]|nr:ATP-binding protein [Chloroflexota bacterium]
MAENQSNQVRFSIRSVVDVVRARRRGMEIALTMGFLQAEANKIAVVISELGRNIEQYAGQGYISVTKHDNYIQIIAEDQGPGISDVDRVLAGGYTTSQGLGLGVSGSKRLMDEFEIQSAVGKGTRIRAVKRLR